MIAIICVLIAGLLAAEVALRIHIERPVQALGRSGSEAVSTVTSRALSDDQKEAAVRRLSGSLALATADFLFRTGLVFAVAIGVGYGLALLVGVSAESVLAASLSAVGLLASTAAIALFVYTRRRLRANP
ncbi:MAG: hypothetical protein V2J26_04600 [Pacificimonas sp.]|jgi:hypothetical protein|nr:hypothetical protein [Pacificimonas sp.]